jgi:SAM-dependent MidA family methyltransferase
MEYCLYDPENGYYTSGRRVFGPSGDFFTSPYAHPWFAEIMADACAAYLDRVDTDRELQLVELGAGEGVLGRTLIARLQTARPALFQRVRYIPVEVGQDPPCSILGVVFSNEFFDALPVHRIRVRKGGLREIYLDLGERIRETEGPLSDPRIVDYMTRGFRTWKEGWDYEANLRLAEVLEDLDRRIERGFVITIDYGFLADEYDRLDRAAGTVLSYHRHRPVSDIYARPGSQDITAHVNFEVLRSAGDSLGWQSAPLKSQLQFLMEWGLEQRLLEEERLGLLNPARLDERLRLKTLLAPGGISETMRVLVQAVRIPLRNCG